MASLPHTSQTIGQKRSRAELFVHDWELDSFSRKTRGVGGSSLPPDHSLTSILALGDEAFLRVGLEGAGRATSLGCASQADSGLDDESYVSDSSSEGSVAEPVEGTVSVAPRVWTTKGSMRDGVILSTGLNQHLGNSAQAEDNSWNGDEDIKGYLDTWDEDIGTLSLSAACLFAEVDGKFSCSVTRYPQREPTYHQL